MRHYRSIGVRSFCFIDNGSNDGTKDFILSQGDCITYYTDESYRESNFAASWVNRVIAELGITGWVVLADADEHLCYSHMESRPSIIPSLRMSK
jgi:glycosyl transferase family 2